MVTLDLGAMGKDNWQVVGLYEPVFVGNFVIDTIYAPQEALYMATKKYNQGTVLLIRTTSTEGKFTDKVTRELKELYEKNNMKVIDSQTQVALRATNGLATNEMGIAISQLNSPCKTPSMTKMPRMV